MTYKKIYTKKSIKYIINTKKKFLLQIKKSIKIEVLIF